MCGSRFARVPHRESARSCPNLRRHRYFVLNGTRASPLTWLIRRYRRRVPWRAATAISTSTAAGPGTVLALLPKRGPAALSRVVSLGALTSHSSALERVAVPSKRPPRRLFEDNPATTLAVESGPTLARGGPFRLFQRLRFVNHYRR
jgi:hypothetical protein